MDNAICFCQQLKELKERQKQQLRHKALKKGLDPEALTGKHPVSHRCMNVMWISTQINESRVFMMLEKDPKGVIYFCSPKSK